MPRINIKQLIEYWQITAESDYETMLWLFKGGRYSDSLFYGHIVLEKILKALVVQKTKKQAPYIHDLVKLSELAECDLLKEEEDILDSVSRFNIKSRYPDYKLKIYKLCNFNFTKEHLAKIKKLYKKLCQELKQKMK